MFGISLPELCIVFVVALIVLGPERLPEVARSLGKTTATLRKVSNNVRKEIYNSIYPPIDEVKLQVDRFSREIRSVDNLSKDTNTTNSSPNNTKNESSDLKTREDGNQ